jgi:hypothetical protein
MMSIETSDERRIEREAIGLYKLEGIARLRSDIDADYIEPCLMVAHRGPACAAEPVQQFRTPAHPTTPLALVLGENPSGRLLWTIAVICWTDTPNTAASVLALARSHPWKRSRMTEISLGVRTRSAMRTSYVRCGQALGHLPVIGGRFGFPEMPPSHLGDWFWFSRHSRRNPRERAKTSKTGVI